jgi:putative membrane protein
LDFSILPPLNAALNSLSAICLITGYVLIRRRRIEQHRAAMLTAFGFSVLFLISYITYHLQAKMTPFTSQGWPRTLYFAILISHTILAVIVAPMVIVTLSRALSQKFDKHKRIARWTLPIWLYVSVTGVLIYFMLYRWFY